jgi:glycosyltransferase involved in cell wall biosynthesis
MPDKKVIIACYGFPPNPGIGGRRWAKFAKYLALAGWQVHVIAAEPKSQVISDWEKDVQHPNIIRHFLPANHPKALNSLPSDSIFKKILFRWSTWYYSKIQDKRIFDTTFLWEKTFTTKLDELIIQHNIENVITSGAPFYQLFYAAKLKQSKHPNLNLITDFRDPWLGATNYGINLLSGKKLAREKEYFKTACEQSNCLIAPTKFISEMILHLDESNHYLLDRFIEFPHSFDLNDIKPFLVNQSADKSKISLVYAGTIYGELEDTFDSLANALDSLKTELPELYQKLNISFYTPPNNVPLQFINHSKVIQFNLPVGKDIFNLINQSTACIVLQSRNNKNFRTTKFFEFISFRKPYIVMGEKGFVSDFVEQNKLGVFISNENFYTQFVDTLEKLAENKLEFNKEFDTTEFSCETQTNRLIALLKQ